LFTIFLFGPCEPLIPILMYPAAQQSWVAVGLVTLVFGLTTLVAMAGMVTVGALGLSRIPFGRVERYGHAMAGLALVVCGAAVTFGL
jgi:sulfite exporter TauE/SafE